MVDRIRIDGGFARPISNTLEQSPGLKPQDPPEELRERDAPPTSTEVEQLAPEDDSWFGANLALELDQHQRGKLARDLLERYETDKQTGHLELDRVRRAMEHLGLLEVRDTDDSSPFEHRVNHPLLAEAMSNFQARAMAELFPPTGPAKAKIVGEADDAAQEQAKRVEDYLNYQLQYESQAPQDELDRLLMWLPLFGTGHLVARQDPVDRILCLQYVHPWDFCAAARTRSLDTAIRYSWREFSHGQEIARAQHWGHYHPGANLIQAISSSEEISEWDRLAMDIEHGGGYGDDHKDDSHYELVHIYTQQCLPGIDDPDELDPPYIITVERTNAEILRIQRNHREEDPLRRALQWVSTYRYLPGVGYNGIGLLHVLSALADATGGSINALLDAAAAANCQGGFVARSAKMAGHHRLAFGEWRPVDMEPEELAKAFVPLPFREPSGALASLAQMLVEEGRRFASVTDLQVGDAKNTGPVGTTLALIEEGGKVQSGIHKRMHRSVHRTLQMITRLNHLVLPADEYPYSMEGEQKTVLRSDFDGRIDVVPVSDPNIWSNTQRIAQAQAAVQLVSSDPQLYDLRKRQMAHKRLFEALRLPDADDYFDEGMDARMDPVSENQTMMVGGTTRAFAEQDHAGHLAIHQRFAQQVQAMQLPDGAKRQLLQQLMVHSAEHMAHQYRAQIEQQMLAQYGMPLPPFDPLADDREELPIEAENALTQAVARMMAQQRPPPPPPPSGDTPEQQEKDAKAIAELDREAKKTQARIRLNREEHEAEMRRKDEEHRAEMQRERERFQQEMRQRNSDGDASE